MTIATDVVIIGAGIAGAAVAYELATDRRVLLLEQEAQPGYHTTGRSAAMYTQTYGNAVVRALTVASHSFLSAPPAGFAATPILTPRGSLLVGRADQRDRVAQAFAACSQLVDDLQLWTGDQVRARVPVFAAAQVDCAVWEPGATDIDVHALHQGYLRGARARGGEILCRAEIDTLVHDGARWRLRRRGADEEIVASVVVNAAGAWADVIARRAGVRAIGLVPKRRTAITFDPPPGAASEHWPAVIDVDEQWYFKPDAGRLLATPADETPSPPCDAQPEELDVALAIDRITSATTMQIARIHAKWAGLRSFVADKTLVLGFDPRAPGFFWCAGQGGYGMQTSAAAARCAAALLRGEALPADVAALGVRAVQLAPGRAGIGPWVATPIASGQPSDPVSTLDPSVARSAGA